jgi:hypothetical protein
MYSTKLVNKNVVNENAYLHVGDKFLDPVPNPFRASPPPKKGAEGEEKTTKPFMTAVNILSAFELIGVSLIFFQF